MGGAAGLDPAMFMFYLAALPVMKAGCYALADTAEPSPPQPSRYNEYLCNSGATDASTRQQARKRAGVTC